MPVLVYISMCVSVQECVYNYNYSSVYVCNYTCELAIMYDCMCYCIHACTNRCAGVVAFADFTASVCT